MAAAKNSMITETPAISGAICLCIMQSTGEELLERVRGGKAEGGRGGGGGVVGTRNAQQVVSHAVEGLWLGRLLQLLNGPALTHIGPKHQVLAILQDAQTDSSIELSTMAKYTFTVVQRHCISHKPAQVRKKRYKGSFVATEKLHGGHWV